MSMSDYVTACCLGKRIIVIDEQKELLRQLKNTGKARPEKIPSSSGNRWRN